MIFVDISTIFGSSFHKKARSVVDFDAGRRTAYLLHRLLYGYAATAQMNVVLYSPAFRHVYKVPFHLC